MDRDQRHRCKFCRKSFPCGRSLGGHMRSHVALMEEEKLNQSSQATNGYGLRENPKKTWRLSAHPSDEKEKQCRECGREFQSLKALFGHMRCHSEKRTALSQQEGEEGSWSCGAHNEGVSSPMVVPKRKRQPRRLPSSVSEYYEKEQEDVAISLMLLSRDFGYWGNSVSGFTPESSDKNSFVLEDRDRDEFKKLKGYVSDDSSSEKRMTRLDGASAKLSEGRFECTTCNKSFRSYQALGGHRASHKRMKGLCFSESSFETVASVDRKGRHRCALCGKVFASGQALGGHKRSHLVVSSIEEEEDLLDLNLPAPVDEDSSNGKGATFDSWWAWSDLKSERMVSNR